MTHKPPRPPFPGSTRLKEGGFLATHKQDFNAHHTGTGFRHGARDTDMEGPLTQLGGALAAPNVQETLEKIGALLGAGAGDFISIGDGYSSVNADFIVGTAGTPTVKDAFDAAFASTRFAANGGIILLKSGTYRIASTITIPAGITVMGEIAGTRIIGELIEQPMFTISASIDRPNTGGSTGDSFDAVDPVHFFNMTFFDNLEGSGPNLTTVPMIELERGSNFVCEKNTFIGRMGTLNFSPISRDKTLEAIGYSTTAGSTNNSVLKVERCFFDKMLKAIDFDATGTDNSLSVHDCRSRTYGTDDGSTVLGTEPEDNCFVSFNNGEIRFVNNFHVGIGFRNVAAFVVTGSAVENLVIIGTTGGLAEPGEGSGTGNEDIAKLVTFSDALISAPPATEMVLTGNNWARWYDDGFTITVGDGISSVGDLTGISAIDDIRLLMQDTPNFGDRPLLSRLIVHPGVYDVSELSPDGFPVIMEGIGALGILPVINLTEKDVQYNFGNTSGIHFASTDQNASILSFGHESSFNVTVSMVIENCIFEDTTVVIQGLDQESSPVTSLLTGMELRSYQKVENCQFRQTGSTLDDHVSLIITDLANNMLVRDCHFSGNGYAFAAINENVAEESEPCLLEIENCDFNLTGGTISDGSPIVDSFFVVAAENLKVKITNTKIVATDGFESVAPISTSLQTSFVAFAVIAASEIYIDGCLFNGPQQTFEDGGEDYALPVLKLIPEKALWFNNSRINAGALPLQITNASFGSTVFTNTDDNFGISITDSEFSTGNDVEEGTLTLLDIDYDYDDGADIEKSIPRINIDSCKFMQNLSDLEGSPNRIVFPVLHFAADPTFSDYYDTQGILQIYANKCDITVSNCNMKGLICPNGDADGSDSANFYENFAGIMIDGYNHTSDTALEGSFGSINVHDNILNIVSGLDNDNGDIAAALLVRGFVNKINNNYLGLNNEGLTFTSSNTSSPNVACSLAMSAPSAVPINDGYVLGYSNSIVTGNTFSQRDLAGNALPSMHRHKGFTVGIDLISEPGLLVDNIFTDDSVSGEPSPMSPEPQVFGPVASPSTRQWTVERNKNMISTASISAASGVMTLGPPDFEDFYIGVPPVATDEDGYIPIGNYIEIISGLNGPTSEDAKFYYTDNTNVTGDTDLEYKWKINLSEVLPLNVEIIEVSLTVGNTPVMNDSSDSGNFSGIAMINDVTVFSTEEDLRVSSHPDPVNGNLTHTLTAGVDFARGYLVTRTAIPLWLYYLLGVNDTGFPSVNPSPGNTQETDILRFEVTYRW